MSVLSERLKELRIESGKKQTDIAAYLGVLPRAIRFYESGDREPGNELLVKLADFFEVSTDYLLGRTDDPAKR
ncbi:MAG: helix-turn-helix domain-containing protein [Oscillospiraceae bacterium]|jgi:transcriptional regulator with XRE-family HTH domain|nr:helix-turn-helix domain-containing protein [Oscillospiraceae bacterium]